ncbi:PREDICTED: WD repeat-containing protein 19-like, partial [Rhagoletis zephyria]|uniref:WD repeat-containing protein 19-like n=1 Tax=Rhagoletis zephyria TaxID=28612 RepID=UPI000811757D
MDTYADILEDLGDRNAPASAADFRTIAIYYEQQQQDGGSSKGQHLLKAGKFYVLAKLYKKGVKLLLQAAAAASASPEEEADALELAIEAAAAARDEQITRLVLDFLMGESDIGNGGNGGNGSNGGGGVGDGLPKDFKYLFKLYMKMEYYKEAAKTAVIISREEQAQGNYRNAHQLLFGMCSELRRHGIAIPPEMTDGLLLVHSYMLAKLWIRAGNHKNSVKLLLRVGDNIGQFPAHATQILTTLVIECQRAGYPKTALKYAQLLMKPESREKVDAKFRRKIETLVRKSAGVVVTPEELDKE